MQNLNMHDHAEAKADPNEEGLMLKVQILVEHSPWLKGMILSGAESGTNKTNSEYANPCDGRELPGTAKSRTKAADSGQEKLLEGQ